MVKIKPHLEHLYRTKLSEKTRKEYLRLDMNECVRGLPEKFVKEIIAGIDSGFLCMYPEYDRLQKKIAAHNNLQSENIGLSNGSDAAIKQIFDAYVEPGDKILLTDPTFAMYPVYCEMFNAKAITVEYNSDLSFPNEDFLSKISPEFKMAVVVNPNNPTGSVIDLKNLNSILKKASDNDVLMIVDEAYFYFYPFSIIEQVRKYKNLIVLRTFSKLCGIAAARLGYAAACPEIIENLRKVRPTYDINGLAALLGEKILDNPNIIQSLVGYVSEGKKYLIKKLSDDGIKYKEGHANFVLIKCNERVEEIVKKLEEQNILVGNGFKQNFLKDYIRVTIGDVMTMEQFWRIFISIWKT